MDANIASCTASKVTVIPPAEGTVQAPVMKRSNCSSSKEKS